jgi:hypothetical protein
MGGDHGLKGGREPVDDRHDLVAVGDGQAAPWAEVELDVDHDQRVAVAWNKGHRNSLEGRFVDEVPAPLAACTTMIVLMAQPGVDSVGVRRGPAALTTRACAPMGLGTGNSAAGRPPCRRVAARLAHR